MISHPALAKWMLEQVVFYFQFYRRGDMNMYYYFPETLVKAIRTSFIPIGLGFEK